MKTKTGVMKSSRHKVASSNQRSEEVADLHALSELAGLNIPPRTMSVLLELLRSGVPPVTLYALLRHIAKHESQHSQAGRSSSRISENNDRLSSAKRH